MRDVDLTSKDVASLGDTSEIMNREWAPCRDGCPVHADVRTYLEHIASGRWREAIDVIRTHLPFAGVCGRICHHPCEANCRRKDVDAAVAIREVKRFVAELQGVSGSTVNRAAVQDKARVAIIGGGPAGMTAALELAKLGYRPTVFEKFPVAGGIPATTVPVYRMPGRVLQIDIDWICAHGVELVTGVEIGKDKTIGQLLAEGYKAVLVAVGLAQSRKLPIPGADHKRVHLVLEFLQAMNAGRRPDVGSDVLVIGGGNVAMDAARSAVRLGTGRVRAVCLEDTQEMPAWEWEVREAKEEGIEIIHRRGPVAIKTEDGAIVGIKARKVTRVFDDQKRFDPQYDDSDVIELDCDTVIFAIGQMPEMGFVRGSQLRVDERARLVWNQATHQTNVENVFACGEIVTAPGSVVEACANGRRAAQAVHHYLSGTPICIDDALPPKIDVIPQPTAGKVIKRERAPVATAPPEARCRTFVEFDQAYPPDTAAREARRCMGCGGGAEVLVDKCSACLTCVRICPFEVPQVTDVARISADKCQACGICVAECPANAIIMRSYNPHDLVARTIEALKDMSGKKAVAYIGGFCATAAEWRSEVADQVPGVAEIYLSSTGGLSVPEVLHAFEKGADAVAVVTCKDGTDRYPTVALRTRRRAEQAQEMLKEIGISPARLQVFEVADAGRDAVRQALVKIAQEAARS